MVFEIGQRKLVKRTCRSRLEGKTDSSGSDVLASLLMGAVQSKPAVEAAAKSQATRSERPLRRPTAAKSETKLLADDAAPLYHEEAAAALERSSAELCASRRTL